MKSFSPYNFGVWPLHTRFKKNYWILDKEFNSPGMVMESIIKNDSVSHRFELTAICICIKSCFIVKQKKCRIFICCLGWLLNISSFISYTNLKWISTINITWSYMFLIFSSSSWNILFKKIYAIKHSGQKCVYSLLRLFGFPGSVLCLPILSSRQELSREYRELSMGKQRAWAQEAKEISNEKTHFWPEYFVV